LDICKENVIRTIALKIPRKATQPFRVLFERLNLLLLRSSVASMRSAILETALNRAATNSACCGIWPILRNYVQTEIRKRLRIVEASLTDQF